MAPLLVMAVGLIPAMRAGVFTIGSEGQFGIGALCAGLATLGVAPHLPAWLAIVTAALAGAGGGLVWAVVPALLRAFLGIDEILTTFAFNFIATFLLLWLLNGPARGKDAFLVQTSANAEGHLAADARRHGRPTSACSCCRRSILAMVVFGRTPAGYRVRLYRRPAVARARRGRAALAGHPRLDARRRCRGRARRMDPDRGVDRAVFGSVFRGYGYLALALVALGRGQVSPTVVGAILFAGLQTGSEAMQLGVGISADFVFVMQGLVLYLMAFRGGAGREL